MKVGVVIADKYRLTRLLGEGSMGSVWLAAHTVTERKVALKLLHPAGGLSDEFRERLLREARVYGRIVHPNVAEIYDVGESDEGEPFLVMQLLEGQTLQAYIKKRKRIDTKETAKIAMQIAAGLEAAHESSIVHRDLKPANVFMHVDKSGIEIVKLLDFGLSKILEASEPSNTVTGSPLGSPAYMAPEQARGERTVDARVDMWAFGVTVFEMLTGKLPFRGRSVYDVVAKVIDGPIPRVSELVPEIEEAMDDLVAKCLTRDPDHRVQSADAAMDLLEPFVDKPTGRAIGIPISRVDAIAAIDDAETEMVTERHHPLAEESLTLERRVMEESVTSSLTSASSASTGVRSSSPRDEEEDESDRVDEVAPPVASAEPRAIDSVTRLQLPRAPDESAPARRPRRRPSRVMYAIASLLAILVAILIAAVLPSDPGPPQTVVLTPIPSQKPAAQPPPPLPPPPAPIETAMRPPIDPATLPSDHPAATPRRITQPAPPPPPATPTRTPTSKPIKGSAAIPNDPG